MRHIHHEHGSRLVRYLPGPVENLAIERAKELFGCDYANVQPHSGAQANFAVQFAICNPGDLKKF